MSIEEALIGQDKATYGQDYHSHVIEQYKLYVELADRVSQRRVNATTAFFASVNTLLLSGYGALSTLKLGGETSNRGLALIAISGILLSFSWRGIVKSYRELVTSKFKVVHELEKLLPLRLFSAEWAALSEGISARRYASMTNIESSIPLMYIAIYLFILISSFIGLF